MPATYDVFVSHAWRDGERPGQIANALTEAGLRVWFDANEISDFVSITHAVTDGLTNSKALLAYYSRIYPLRRACQWELTTAFLAAQTEGDPVDACWSSIPKTGPTTSILSNCATRDENRNLCRSLHTNLPRPTPAAVECAAPLLFKARPKTKFSFALAA
jgi:hypothetical protein